eukprot:TRINITY_DN4920_c0_g1_i1.p1 TRINITY_DN4920_c0_g1~~TRINITY_DN4920_c0_g1_i1.p1  ORF type:complete len:227 (-),score=79.02 TRINITY_DN4920_c0_g1_i1:65-703(-)
MSESTSPKLDHKKSSHRHHRHHKDSASSVSASSDERSASPAITDRPVYLVCYDGSKDAEKTIDYMLKNARQDARIILFGSFETVDRVKVQPTTVPGAVYVPSPGDEWVKQERHRRSHNVSYHLMRAKQRLLDSGRGFDDLEVHEVVAESDDVRATVLDIAQKHKVDAIIVGSRGHGTIKRALLGSLSSYLVHHFEGNVIVCRASTAAAPAAK